MATNAANRVIRHLRKVALGRDQSGLTDGDLLEQYVARGDELAFEALLRRHGPMVLGVCRRVLRNQADAEDAFQATFLVLVRKAASIRSRATVGNWLYGVAHNTALKAQAMNRKRGIREREAGIRRKPPASDEFRCEVQALLDTELSLLPERYRIPIVLCDLEGRTIKEAARHLGWPQGTTATRLARGRALLVRRLAKHGLTLSAAVLSTVLTEATATARMAPVLLRSRLAAARSLTGKTAAAGLISTRVAILTEGVLQSMFLSKLKSAVGMVLLVAALALGAGALARPTQAANPSDEPSSYALPKQDQGNLKETVLALEKRIWDALKTQDRAVFQNLVADDFVGMDPTGRHYDKADTLQFVSQVTVPEYEMKDVRVVFLNRTSALVTYDIHYKIRPAGKQEITEDAVRHAIRAWTQRNGKWWYVYYEDRLVNKESPFSLLQHEEDKVLLQWSRGARGDFVPPVKPE